MMEFNSSIMKIILDTNFLMAVSQFKINIFSQLRGHQIYVVNTVIRELERFSKGSSKRAKAAQLALTLVKTKHLKVLKSKEKSADRSLILYAKRGYIIATQDKVLQKKIKDKGGQIIYIRQRKYVII